MSAVVALSGGMDSATVLAKAIEEYGPDKVCAVGFQYGSKHNVLELQAARQIAIEMDVDFEFLDVRSLFNKSSSALMDKTKSVPEGYYEAETMRQTVVPGRNLIFLSILASLAENRKAETVWTGIHAGDHFIYPDCRPAFFDAANAAIWASTDQKVRLRAPFLNETKLEILQYGVAVGVPYHMTRTCYTNQPTACGKCGSCQERLTAWARLGQPDPIEYESRALIQP